MPELQCARKTPCASCPYRQNAPSGIWNPEEYAKLPPYDKPLAEQPPRRFMCHQGQGDLCSGWLATHGPTELLSVRVGLVSGEVDPSVLDYETTVPVFESGTAAAIHGLAEVTTPSPEAESAIAKLVKKRGLTGDVLGRDAR